MISDMVDRSGTLPLSLSRYYNGHADRLGALGYRWSHSFDTRLVVTEDGDAGVVFGDGREAFFDWREAIGTTPAFHAADPRVKDTLVKNADGTYTFTTTANLAYRFAADSRLTGIGDLNGNALTPAYDAQGRVASVSGPGGATLTFAYTAQGRLGTVTDPDGGVTTYGYDAAGDLVSVRNPAGGTTTYAYDRHRLTRVTDENGQTLFTNTLDSVHRVVTQTDAAGKTIQVAYDTPAKGATRVTDPNGNAATYYFDAWHRTTDKVDPQGHVASQIYDGEGNLQKVVNPKLNQWQFAYDSAGQVTAATDPNNFSIQVSYNVQHLPTTVRDGRGNITTLEYDGRGNVIRRTDPLNGVWEYSYDGRGNMLSERNPLGQTTTYTYNARNQRTAKTDPLNKTWRWEYSSLGHKESETDPLGKVTRFDYDLFGRLLTRTDALGHTTTYTYDARGLLASEENALGERTVYGYDSRGLLTARTDPAGKIWTYTYDDNRNRLTETNPLGQTTRYGYDEQNRVVTVTDPLGNVTTTTYDAAGTVASERDPLGRTTSYTYDGAGRVLTETRPNGAVTTFTYDADGNRLTERNAQGRTTTFAYDALSRLVSVGDALANETTYTYDAAGRRAGMTDGTGTTTWAYDAAGRTASIAAPQGTVGYSYNAAGQRASMVLPGMRTVRYDYDAATGRLNSLTNWQNKTTDFGYDTEGRRATITRPNGVVTTNTYDAAGRITEVSHVKDTTTLKSFSYTYDAAGNRISATSGAGTETYTLDALGRLTGVSYPGGQTESYTYDAHGNRSSTTAGGTTTTYTYDDADQLLTEGSITYTYDSAGNVTGRGGDTFTWDWGNRLTGATVGGTTTTYAYDGDDVRVEKTQGAVTTSYLWDRASGLPLLVDDGTTGYISAGETLLEQVPTTGGGARYLLGDALGSIRGSSDAVGALVGSADYAVFGAVRGTNTTGSVFGFTGEQHDQETGFTFLRARYYDPVSGRFASVDTVQPNAPGSQGYHVYAYAANNPTTWTDPSGHFVLIVSPVSVVITAMFAQGAVTALAAVSTLAAMGLLVACAADDVCGPKLAGAWRMVTMLTHPAIRPWTQLFPIMIFTVAWMAGTRVIEAVAECVKSGACLPDCDHRPSVPVPGTSLAVQPPLPGFEHSCDPKPCDTFPENGKYAVLAPAGDRIVPVGRGKRYEKAQKDIVLLANWWVNNRQLRDDITGEPLDWPIWKVPRSRVGHRAEVDHRCPSQYGGRNSMGNACVIKASINASKRHSIPSQDYCTQ